jgi:hypothetical protein
MPRKRPPARPQPSNQPGEAKPAPGGGPPIPVMPLLFFAAAALVELLLYYGNAPQQHLAQRQQSLVFLLAPDELFVMWCGGKLDHFSLFDRWPIVLLSGVVLCGAWLAGRLVLFALGITRLLDRLERQVFALGVGLNLLSLYALGVGLAGRLQQRWVFVAPLVGLAIGNILLWVRSDPSRSTTGQASSGTLQASSGTLNDARWCWWLAAALPYAVIIVLGSMLPPWTYDVREYHLQTPKEWFQNGRVDFLPHNIYSNMPLGSELTALWGMALAGGKDGWWWGAMTGKTVMGCYSLIAAAGLVAFGRRVHSLAAGVIAAVVYLSTPWIVSVSLSGYNEGPVALYALLAIYSLRLAGRDENRTHQASFVLLAGFLAGSAVACKYPPLLFVVVPLAVWVAGFDWLARNFWRVVGEENGNAALNWRPRAFCAVLFTVGVATACGLWFGKNAALASNPTYPLLYPLFDGRTRTPEKDRQWTKVHSPQPDKDGNRFSTHQFLDQITWNVWRTLWASLVIPPLAVVAWMDRRRWPLIAAMGLWMLFVFVTWWLFTHRLDRFLVLVLPLAALVAALGVFAVPHPAWRAATLSFVLFGAIAHFPFVALHPDNRYFAPLEWLRRDDRELGNQGLRVEAAHRWLNEHAQPGERVLLLGDAEPFDLELPAVYNTCFDDCQFTRIFEDRTRAERLETLRAEKIAYVFCSWSHLARYRSPGNYGYSSKFPTPELVHNELVNEQKLLVPIDTGTEPEKGELFRVASE